MEKAHRALSMLSFKWRPEATLEPKYNAVFGWDFAFSKEFRWALTRQGQTGDTSLRISQNPYSAVTHKLYFICLPPFAHIPQGHHRVRQCKEKR